MFKPLVGSSRSFQKNKTQTSSVKGEIKKQKQKQRDETTLDCTPEKWNGCQRYQGYLNNRKAVHPCLWLLEWGGAVGEEERGERRGRSNE